MWGVDSLQTFIKENEFRIKFYMFFVGVSHLGKQVVTKKKICSLLPGRFRRDEAGVLVALGSDWCVTRSFCRLPTNRPPLCNGPSHYQHLATPTVAAIGRRVLSETGGASQQRQGTSTERVYEIL